MINQMLIYHMQFRFAQCIRIYRIIIAAAVKIPPQFSHVKY